MQLSRIVRVLGAVGTGATGSFKVELQAYAKDNRSPYCIPNEFICGNLGRLLGLPIPPVGLIAEKRPIAMPPTVGGALATPGTGGGAPAPPVTAVPNTFVCTLDFNFLGGLPPAVDAADCVRQLPRLSAGVVLFDVLIANPDRHPNNFAMDTLAVPPVMNVFDHSHALFGPQGGNGIAHLLAILDEPYIGGHCLARELETNAGFQEWVDRVKQIPDYFIDDITEEVVDLGANTSEIAEARSFLRHRRGQISDILNKNAAVLFPKIKSWTTLT